MKLKTFIALCIVFFSVPVFSQPGIPFKFWNPVSTSGYIEGQAWPNEVKDPYDRLPQRAEKTVRKPLWDLSKNSAGLQLHFQSNANEIIVRYTISGDLQMPHMPATGVSGVDLYAKGTNGKWLWAGAKYSFGDTIIYRFTNLIPEKREFRLYLPLYNTVKWMEIGVPEKSSFEPLPARQERPIVVYGTSIAQGACASRPGLAWTNILSRRFNIPFVNLAFSGNGRLEKEIIDLLKEIDARVYILDCLPNMTSAYLPIEELKKRIVNAVQELRAGRPLVPILLTEHDGYSDGEINPLRKKQYADANEALKKMFDSLSAAGVKDIYVLTKEGINQDIETMADGTHPNDIGMMRYADAYQKKLKSILKKPAGNEGSFLQNVQPALIPLPQQVIWNPKNFSLEDCKFILVKNAELIREAKKLRQIFLKKGFSMSIVSGTRIKQSFVELSLNKTETPQNAEEAYHLSVNANRIIISGNSTHGVFNGMQTLRQLTTGGKIAGCEITDWPAFSWRGYMVDVGRNFESVNLLKQQIEVMSEYKLNIFHFHLTEDIAWRLAVKQYPQLTDAGNMLRNEGKFYSEKDLKDLILFCKKRYIILVPEIDVPGHSGAFVRAMKTDMQSDSGTVLIKNILGEICKTYDFHYMHIGGDEVKITNRNFLPEMAAMLKSLSKKVIAWDPGGNVPEGTILQMWNGASKPKEGFPAIDSRHLYLNHFDPMEGVVTVFNHIICDAPFGDENKLGATLCNWPDRKVNKEEDLITMNAVYSVMLAFAERTWRGGGWQNYLSDFGDPPSGRYNAFVQFEKRLLQHRSLYFKKSPFSYVKQSDIEWKLIGPFLNSGKTETVFTPESKLFFDPVQLQNYPSVYGATIVLRHFFHPMIQGYLKDPHDSETYYAVRKIWSNQNGAKKFWIGFNDISRSTATDSPPAGQWDYKSSAVWVNGKIVEPPEWKHAGQKGNSEIPLQDEGYAYREPTKIVLKKGWNNVLIKLPVGTFKAAWQNPIKWEFTFAEAPQDVFVK